MRSIALLILLIAAAAWYACHVELSATPPERHITLRWVRTRHGWERPANWQPPPPVHRPTLHPLTVAAGQLLLSITVLAAIPATSGKRSS